MIKESLKKWVFTALMASNATLQAIDIQGHRGARGTHPENTLPAFAAAIEAGVDAIELDLLSTQDGEIVIHHNFFVNPLLCNYLDGTPLVNAPLVFAWPLSLIKTLDCGSKVHPKFPQQRTVPGTQIPTLRELFDMIKTYPHPHAATIRFNLEIKADTNHPDYTPPYSVLAKKIIQLVQQYGFSERVYYSSFDPVLLAEVRKIDPHAVLGFIFDARTVGNKRDWIETIIDIGHQLQATILSPDDVLLNGNHIQMMHEAGFHVIPWTVNDWQRCLELIEQGVDGIITDYPQDVIEQLRHPAIDY